MNKIIFFNTLIITSKDAQVAPTQIVYNALRAYFEKNVRVSKLINHKYFIPHNLNNIFCDTKMGCWRKYLDAHWPFLTLEQITEYEINYLKEHE